MVLVEVVVVEGTVVEVVVVVTGTVVEVVEVVEVVVVVGGMAVTTTDSPSVSLQAPAAGLLLASPL